MPTVDFADRPLAEPMAIVVVNFGSHELIERNLASVDLPPGVRVVVVDNLSTSNERAAIRVVCRRPGWDLVEMSTNAGFGAATNAGIRRAADAGCVCFLMLNPDAQVSGAVVAALHEHSLREPTALITPRIMDSSGRVIYRGSQLQLSTGRLSGAGLPGGDGGETLHLEKPVRSSLRGPTQGWLPGACLVIHREMFDKTGGFADDYFLYWEDVDLSRRVIDSGGSLQVRQDLVAVHDEGGTHGQPGSRARSTTYYYYNCRNRLVFAALCLPRRDVLRWILRSPAESWQILLRGGRRQLVHSPRPLLAACRGTLSGVLVAVRVLLTRRPGRAHARQRRRMLIAHPGAELYGSDRVMLESLAALTEAGIEVTVALPEDGPLSAEIRRHGGTPVQCAMPVLRKSALRPGGFVRLVVEAARSAWPAMRLVRSAGRDGVYVSTSTVPMWIVLARLSGRAVVCHVHEAEASAPRALRTAMAAPMFLAGHVLVNSRFSADTLTGALPGLRRRVTLVYNAVAAPPLGPAPRTELLGRVRLVYVGRLSPRKGVDVAVAAVSQLRDRGLDVEFDIVGTAFSGYEWFEQQLRESVSASGISDRVRFQGFRSDVWPALYAADIALVPSVVDEPFGNTAVEAALAARPSIVSSTSGLREAAAGYGSSQFVAPADATAIADAVMRAIDRWAEFAKLAVEDAVTARERHGPRQYRANILAAMS